MSDKRGGVVVRTDGFLLVNMNLVEQDGSLGAIVTLDFQGDELPVEADMMHELIVLGSWNTHPKHGRQFAVKAWAVNDETQVDEPKIRYKAAKKLSAAAMKRLLSEGKEPE